MENLHKAITEILQGGRLTAINLIEQYINKTAKEKVEFNNEWVKFDHNKVGGIPLLSGDYFVVSNKRNASICEWRDGTWLTNGTVTHFKQIILPIK